VSDYDFSVTDNYDDVIQSLYNDSVIYILCLTFNYSVLLSLSLSILYFVYNSITPTTHTAEIESIQTPDIMIND